MWCDVMNVHWPPVVTKCLNNAGVFSSVGIYPAETSSSCRIKINVTAVKNSAPTSLLSLAASITGTVISAGLRLVLPCYWCCSIRPFKKQAHVGHARETEKNLVCFGCDFSGWNCGHQMSYLKLKCTKFDFGWRSAHTALGGLQRSPSPLGGF